MEMNEHIYGYLERQTYVALCRVSYYTFYLYFITSWPPILVVTYLLYQLILLYVKELIIFFVHMLSHHLDPIFVTTYL